LKLTNYHGAKLNQNFHSSSTLCGTVLKDLLIQLSNHTRASQPAVAASEVY